MHHFFVSPQQVKDEQIRVHGTDVNHMKNVLRMRIGEQVKISDETKTYLCEVHSIEAEEILLKILEEQSVNTELPSRIFLFQGLPKSDKMEWIIQKAVELGVHEIIPVVTKRAVVKLDEKKASKKVERWNAIAEGGAKQSGRIRVPQVKAVMSYKEALDYATNLDVLLVPYELAEGMNATRKVISEIQPGQSVGIFIGPEGGFEESEINQAMEQNAKIITLGKRILRTETAGMTTLAILMYHLEDASHNL